MILQRSVICRSLPLLPAFFLFVQVDDFDVVHELVVKVLPELEDLVCADAAEFKEYGLIDDPDLYCQSPEVFLVLQVFL